MFCVACTFAAHIADYGVVMAADAAAVDAAAGEPVTTTAEPGKYIFWI